MEISTTLQQMVQNLDSIFGIPTDTEIVNEKNPEPGIILQLFRILGHIFTGQTKKLIHHITVVEKLAAVIQAAIPV